MNSNIRVTKAFTLIELMIVILLIGSVYFLAFSSFQTKGQKQYKVSIENIKEFISKNFPYENSLSFVCIDKENLPCYIFKDGELLEDLKIENLFAEVPEVYNYDKQLSDFRFKRYRIENSDYEAFFELTFDSDFKHKNIVVDGLDSKVYLITSISKNIEVFSTTNEIISRFDDLEIEVKDAF